jgi:hypothetical protein
MTLVANPLHYPPDVRQASAIITEAHVNAGRKLVRSLKAVYPEMSVDEERQLRAILGIGESPYGFNLPKNWKPFLRASDTDPKELLQYLGGPEEKEMLCDEAEVIYSRYVFLLTKNQFIDVARRPFLSSALIDEYGVHFGPAATEPRHILFVALKLPASPFCYGSDSQVSAWTCAQQLCSLPLFIRLVVRANFLYGAGEYYDEKELKLSLSFLESIFSKSFTRAEKRKEIPSIKQFLEKLDRCKKRFFSDDGSFPSSFEMKAHAIHRELI